jgi:hypothetical protein
MSTDDGQNLLEPGKTPHDSFSFAFPDSHSSAPSTSMPICCAPRPPAPATITGSVPTKRRRPSSQFFWANS